MEARFRRSERDPERDGDLRQWQVEIVIKDDQRPRIRLETAEAAFELVAVVGDGYAVVDRRRVDGSQFDIDPVPPEPARLIDTGTDEQPVEPGVETIGAAQCGQVTPGADERLLDGVLCLVGIAQDEPGGSVQPEDRGACQRGEGVMIAPSRSLHEFLLHHAPRRRRGRHDRAHRVWRGDTTASFRNRPGRGATRYHRSPTRPA